MIEYIKILQDQGVSTFDPVKFYNEAKVSVKKDVDISTLSKKDRKQVKKSKMSKKTLKMIENNIKNKEDIHRDEEDRKLYHFIENCNTIDEMVNLVNRMKTSYGRINSKIVLLEKCLDNNLDIQSHLIFYALNEEADHKK